MVNAFLISQFALAFTLLILGLIVVGVVATSGVGIYGSAIIAIAAIGFGILDFFTFKGSATAKPAATSRVVRTLKKYLQSLFSGFHYPRASLTQQSHPPIHHRS
ncbi:hypothetical protein BC936DRAFT_139559 [Jimgerdemannia flammicorona]|uniref:Uncharacterized protein n=1 Tax=Jimgerdemannia flammicorona TaxID=994334 RepID=A0A433B9N2_9FUNG|nr:hypothetical protein BC936DRAFT_139559 [Jimgerdemannia flammicorona]